MEIEVSFHGLQVTRLKAVEASRFSFDRSHVVLLTLSVIGGAASSLMIYIPPGTSICFEMA